ncbi:hypothetical protein AGDE_04358 [Angomonas deanei]|nr:hypothetical protein AGDE_04358 [Angomonas deanei]|eukprot:EPY39570.1 hypothetical protein AGDE_04358 [Angomonas deanei]
MLISDDLKLLCLAVSFDNTTAVTPKSALDGVGNNPSDGFCLYHYFRPNRPVNELTRPLDRFYVHRPTSSVLDDLLSQQWTPKLNPPTRDKSKKVSPLPAYNPPQSYLMGLAERLAVIPGNSFGRRSLMWGHWF